MLAHWAQRYQRADIAGALLAAPADLETPMPAGYPTVETTAGTRLVADTTQPSALSQHRRGEQQRSVGIAPARRAAGARLGQRVRARRRRRPSEPCLGIRRVAAGGSAHRTTRSYGLSATTRTGIAPVRRGTAASPIISAIGLKPTARISFSCVFMPIALIAIARHARDSSLPKLCTSRADPAEAVDCGHDHERDCKPRQQRRARTGMTRRPVRA